jgi:hypothetical protein
MSEFVKGMIDNIAKGDLAVASDNLKSEIEDRISTRIADRAKTMITDMGGALPKPEATDTDENEVTDEVTDSSEKVTDPDD